MPRLRPAPDNKKEDIIKGSSATDEPEIVIEAAEEEPEIEIVDPLEETKDDASASLQRQLDELKKSEQIQKDLTAQAFRDRDEAIRLSRENQAQLERTKKESQEYQVTSIASALAAAQAEAEKAQLDIENAISLGDNKGQAEAHRRLARAESRIDRLEEGKEALANQVKEVPVQQVQQQQQDPLANSTLPPVVKDYLRQHPELLSDPRRNAKLQSLHWDALDEGHPEFSPDYMKFMDEKLYPKSKEEQQQQPQKRNVPVSAPVSREAHNSDGKRLNGGKVTLTAEEKDMAKVAGISVEEYAKQKLKLSELRANGQYGGDQR